MRRRTACRAIDIHPPLVFVATLAGGQLFGLAEVIFVAARLSVRQPVIGPHAREEAR